jgi:Rrf2 family transcriptional regulator, cysteine metabolism repressor
MGMTQKCQYALRALFELAKREGGGVARAADIAEIQAIPRRFLEVILHQLRQGGFVEAARGKEGGFFLARPARSIRVGDIVRFMDGPIRIAECSQDKPAALCPLVGSCVFQELWDDARVALEQVYDAKTLDDLVEMERRLFDQGGMHYSI